MRARGLKPGLFKNEILGSADPLCTLLFEGLWCMADRDGRLEDRPLRIRAEIFPYRQIDIEELLQWLVQNGFIVRYTVNAANYISINNFAKHQNPHKKEVVSEIPAPPSLDEDAPGEDPEIPGQGREILALARLTPDSGLLTPDSGLKKTLVAASDDGPTVPTGQVAHVITAWNTITAGKLPKAKPTPKRQATIHVRLKEPGWYRDFESACRFMAETPWYSGNNDRQWVATIDFALQAGKATELAEKATQQAPKSAAGASNGHVHHRTATDQRYIAQLAARDARRAETGLHAVEPAKTDDTLQGMF